jgi:hydroxymethylpyrimidine/phosphomethylpyrimidine kinase
LRGYDNRKVCRYDNNNHERWHPSSALFFCLILYCWKGIVMEQTSPIYRALTIAGSDSGAGAGIQADLKTFAALGVYGLSALTAITAQNTQGVRVALELPTTLITAQIDAVLEDIGADAAKTGMLSSSAVIEVVAECVQRWQLRLVVDPVMRAKGGDPLLAEEAVESLRAKLLPLAEVITPNLPEAEVLIGSRIETLDEMKEAARAIHAQGPRYVVIKGGHRVEEPVDIYFDGEQIVELRAERIDTPHTHGTGCTFSAAIAALIARGWSVGEAIAGAKQYITGAIQHAPGIGHGHGPVEHFWMYTEQGTPLPTPEQHWSPWFNRAKE